jgi:hypothetical protein
MGRHDFLSAALDAAVAAMDLKRDSSELTFNTYGGSVGARVLDADTEQRWLRVGRRRLRDNPRQGWATSAAITGVSKPMWYRTHEFEHQGEAMRADLLSLAPSPACTRDLILTERPPIAAEWFRELRRSIDALERFPTERSSIDAERVRSAVLSRVGSRFPCHVERFVTSHTDMHWCNITAPTFCLLDWDSWGLAPYGFGPATAYCAAILVPDIANEIYATFRDQLETPDGQISLMLAADHLLHKVSYGDHLELADPLHEFIGSLLA